MSEAKPYRCPRCGQLAHRVTHLPLPGGSTAMCLDGHEWDPFPDRLASFCPSCGATDQRTAGECPRCGNHCFQGR